jgi:hypothetical protein
MGWFKIVLRDVTRNERLMAGRRKTWSTAVNSKKPVRVYEANRRH